MPGYRRPLANLVFDFCRRVVAGEHSDADYCDIVWKILADEVVLRIFEGGQDEEEGITVPGQDPSVETIVTFLAECAEAAEPGVDDDAEEPEFTSNFESHGLSSPHTAPHISSTFASPLLSRVQSDVHAVDAGSSRSQSLNPSDDSAEHPSSGWSGTITSRSYPMQALSALISIFSQLCFTPHSPPSNLDYVLAYILRVFESLIFVLVKGNSVRARLATLQFLMRLRADRDHRLYFSDAGYDPEGQVVSLSALINRVGSPDIVDAPPPTLDAVSELRKARARARIPPSERDMVTSRDRGGRLSQSHSRNATSRSRSRVGGSFLAGSGPRVRNKSALWKIPEQLLFTVDTADTTSEILGIYDPSGPDGVVVLPISEYLSALLNILESEKNWNILSYVLCHLPVQLANKHLFCGPKSRIVISKILTMLCLGVFEGGNFARSIERWPSGIKSRDAHGLVYHTLSVLVSYKRYFDTKQRHLLVEVFLGGLSGQPATIMCCLNALSISAFELQPSSIRYLSDILEKLFQIMSNPDMAVHILSFLSIVGSHPPLYSNFVEKDFKIVFGVALQYLQHHNRMTSTDSPDSVMSSWALSQHVRILSYHLVYVWFLAVKLPDRPKYLGYITKQLLLANTGNEQVDDLTEVCFDWLARYTYASADPRPADSLLQDIIINSASIPEANETPPLPEDPAASEKTWLLGNSVVTVRALRKLGWLEILSRRPSGYTKFLGRLENVPLVGPGDVNPDMLTIPAVHLMDREFSQAHRPDASEDALEEKREERRRQVHDLLEHPESDLEEPSRPDPLAGYVWSRTAPSQRRKDVAIDPSFFALQFSSYPDRFGPSSVRVLVDSASVPKFTANLDRMPVIDTHKVGIMYVAPGQTSEVDILRNTHGSPAYTCFLEGIGRLINLRGQIDVYAGGLNPDEDGEYAYAWWDDIGQILYHTATMMPSHVHDEHCTFKKRHIGNDFVRIVWNDSGMPYRFDTLATQFQFVNIVIEPHSVGHISAYSSDFHETEYFKVTVQRADNMIEFAPVGHYKLVSAGNLPLLVRQLSLLADWFAYVFQCTERDTKRVEVRTNWQERLSAIRRFKDQQIQAKGMDVKENDSAQESRDGKGPKDSILAQQAFRDFTSSF